MPGPTDNLPLRRSFLSTADAVPSAGRVVLWASDQVGLVPPARWPSTTSGVVRGGVLMPTPFHLKGPTAVRK